MPDLCFVELVWGSFLLVESCDMRWEGGGVDVVRVTVGGGEEGCGGGETALGFGELGIEGVA
jgi:hypothetical protein